MMNVKHRREVHWEKRGMEEEKEGIRGYQRDLKLK
jgi:hypothetical protein